MGWYFRQPKTINEMRQYYKKDSAKVRGRRRPDALWFTFDDAARQRQRSWKYQRKTSRQHGRDQKQIRHFKRTAPESNTGAVRLLLPFYSIARYAGR